MRLGGVSKTEFRALTTVNSLAIAAAWSSERLDICHRTHHLCTELSSFGQGPARLLSIRSPDLVAIVDGDLDEGPYRYAALSYCWGGDQETKLTELNQQQLRAGVNPGCLSQTVQDAIVVCRSLKIDYLWVDALCILQGGDSDDWYRQALTLHKIYGGAYVTLGICSAERAQQGFLHEQHNAMPVDPERCSIVGMEETAMLPVPVRKTLAHARTETPLAQRGWIFQEELLSPRIIYWSEQGLYWSCCAHKDAQNGTSYTDELFPQLTPPTVMDAQGFRTSPDPLLLWDDMISSFSVRDFTIDDDRLPAVNGLAAVIEQATGEEYLLGFWKSRLPAQLLWIVTGPLQHRESRPQAESGAPNIKPPSWSWASVAPARKIVMPKQASHRAQFRTSIGSQLHLRGRTRLLTAGLSPLWSYPEEESSDMVGPRYPMLKYQPRVWAVDRQQNRLLVSLDWRRPIIIHLDDRVPSDDSFDRLVCFEINYIGFLLLEPSRSDTKGGEVFKRVGCAQVHRESRFFDGSEEKEVIIE
ncbi:hypothetical protein AMS68_006109 [Peltaster fructicola]|uniref:Heterokaryon incompatibility domain-containing protein n=1 Tax=Peltaster fructicola TaxID=286661 RepID=A0A6H0Y0N5_9PEZI|nr:hypothetical protein AMS68_006109 [Peltaster fructicola]